MFKQRKKILVPIFNRAHYGRLRPVLKAIQSHPELELQVAVGLSHAYGNFFQNIKYSRPYSWRLALSWYLRAQVLNFLSNFKPSVLQNDFLVKNISQDGFPIHARVPLFLDGGDSDTMAKVVGLGIVKVTEILKKLKPDIVFVNADRFEMIAVALAAAYLNIPIAHNEGGDVSGTIDESVRHAITKLSHIHFTSTENSRKRVLQMGEDPNMVFTVGSPAIDVVSKLDTKLTGELIPALDLTQPYLLVLLHSVATESKSENKLMAENVIEAIEAVKMPTVFLGSNMDAGSDVVGQTARQWREKNKDFPLFFTKSLPPNDFYKLLANAACALGNSSSFIREGAYFGTPAVLVGSRQGNRERGKNVKEAAAESEAIKKAVLEQIKHGRYERDPLFGDGGAGEKISVILAKAEPKIQKEFYEYE